MLLLRQALPADQRPLAHWQSALETAICDGGGGGGRGSALYIVTGQARPQGSSLCIGNSTTSDDLAHLLRAQPLRQPRCPCAQTMPPLLQHGEEGRNIGKGS